MRDPLHRISVKYKLVLMFVAVCLLVLGVGGVLVSDSAERSLNSEIEERLEFQARAYATALDAHMTMLARRTEDFASDGHIRALLTGLISSPSPDEGERLRKEMSRHLQLNKLPLVESFVDLTVIGQNTGISVSPLGDAAQDHVRLIAEGSRGEGTWFSGLVASREQDLPALAAVGTPLRSLDGKRRIGTLISWIHPGIWITSALVSADLRTEHRGVSLSLVDPGGSILDVAQALLDRTGPSPDSEALRSGFGLKVRRRSSEADGRRIAPRLVFSRSYPLSSSSWSVRIEQDTKDARDAVVLLQNRFLAVGIVLALVAGLLLYFPIRFLARPLVNMQEALGRIQSGDFSARVEVQSNDEIGDLAKGLNHMAEAVEERTGRLERVALDLEERQALLRRESDRLAGVISSMKDGLIVLDAKGEPVLSNMAARPLLLAIEGHGGEATAHHACKMRGEVGNCIACLFDPVQTARSCMVDLGARVFEVHSTRLPADGNGRFGKVLVSRDISDRVAQDERQIHQERLAVLGEVAAVMAHELNNPLAAITMFSQMLQSDMKGDGSAEEKLDVILRNAATCKITIRELLDYATNATPEVDAVDVHEVISDVVRFLRPVRERAGVELVQEHEASMAEVTGDEVQVRQIFVNLVVNALQAVPENGSIGIKTRNKGDYVEVDVSDSGGGVPPEAREQIFKPFFTTKPRGEGTGLGLPTALRIAEVQGGSLELVNGTSQGATFRVRLRLKCEAEV